ncbi:3'-5' exonuclease [Oesophagostomum dentatum]|uniref:3'-5' exonuclease n=1 Tax=Oesophagostomum dentatum TaxID=61180 RepID=A0A0B1TPP6_OESDE|nr:3'-5' exonuclease [Oesophagostomum dentatum]
MRDELLSEFISEPAAILHALYLGPLGAPTVEAFASGRSADFRKQCRAVLDEVMVAVKSPEDFSAKKPSVIRDDNPELCSYPTFRRNAQALIRDLKGEARTDTTIPMGWACAALKKFARKTYIEKTWKEENLYELIWTIMCQRPNLKKYVKYALALFTSNMIRDRSHFISNGIGSSATCWRRIFMTTALLAIGEECILRSCIEQVYEIGRNESCYDPLLPTTDHLNFLSDVKGIEFIQSAADLHLLCLELKRLRSKDPAVPLIVGLDAEWSAYVANSRATILQLALREKIYIIDLENRTDLPASALREFFDLLFLDKGILKLGFQFNEDLVQMRAAVPHCRALFEPENVICVGRMVAELLERTEKLKDSNEILKDVLPPVNPSQDVEQPDAVVENEVENAVELDASQLKRQQSESVVQRTVNRGLSYVCERVLGRPLDKTEQCSVWDRRPLRSSQLRYAAMDAYCLILIYDVCCRWAQRLDISIEEILKQQEPIRVSPPLLSDEF